MYEWVGAKTWTATWTVKSTLAKGEMGVRYNRMDNTDAKSKR